MFEKLDEKKGTETVKENLDIRFKGLSTRNGEKLKSKCFSRRSAKKKDCHIEIIISNRGYNKNPESLKTVIEEFRKAIRRVNHLSGKKYSYELKTKGYFE